MAVTDADIDSYVQANPLPAAATVSPPVTDDDINQYIKDNPLPQTTAQNLLNVPRDTFLNLFKGAIDTAALPIKGADYLTADSSQDPDQGILGALTSGYNQSPAGQDLHSAIHGAAQSFQGASNDIENAKSAFSQSSAQNQPIFTKNNNPNDTLPFNVNAPSISQLSNLAGTLAPQLGLYELGGEAGAAVPATDTAAATAANPLLSAAGTGAVNAAVSGSNTYEEVYSQAYAQYKAQGKSNSDADQLAQNTAQSAVDTQAPIDLMLGGGSMGAASTVEGNAAMRALKGFSVGAAPMATMSALDYANQQSALGKSIDPYAMASQGAQGAMNAAMDAYIGVKEGGPKSAPTDDSGANAPAASDASTNSEPNYTIDPSTGRVVPVSQNADPVTPDGPNPDISTARSTINSITSGDTTNIDAPTLKTLSDNGFATIGDDGKPTLTPIGDQLNETLKNVSPEIEQTLTELEKQHDSLPVDSPERANIVQQMNDLYDSVPIAEPKPSDNYPIDPADRQLAALELQHDALPDNDPQKNIIKQKMSDIVESMPVVKATAEKVGVPAVSEPDPQALHDYYHDQAEKLGIEHIPSDTDDLISAVNDAQAAKTARMNADPYNDMQYSTTPTDKFTSSQDDIKSKVNDIIQKINPDVDSKFVDELFGQGEALKESGAESTERQPVAGQYDKLNNIITTSLSGKFDPIDTAYHEAYHSIESMLSQKDQETLNNAYPGTDKMSASEQRAVEFAKYAKDQSVPVLGKARMVFNKIRNIFNSIKSLFKGKQFHSPEDVFNRVISGDVYNKFQDAIKNNNSDVLRDITSKVPPDQVQDMVKQVSPQLHDVVYKAASPEDNAALKDVATEAYGTPEEKLKSFGEQAYEKGRLITDKIIGKALDSTADILSKVPGMRSEEVRARLREQVEEIKEMTAYHPREDGETSMAHAAESAARMLVWSAENHIRWEADSQNIPAAREVADKLFNEPGKPGTKDMPFGQMKEYMGNNWKNRFVKVIKDEKIPKSQLPEITKLMQDQKKLASMDTTKGVARAAIVGARIVQEIRQEYAKVGREIPEANNYFPRIDDMRNVLKDENGWKQQRDKTNIITYGKQWEEEHAKELGQNPNVEPDINKYIQNKARDKTENDLQHLKSRDIGVKLEGDKFSPVPVTPDIPSGLKQRTLAPERDELERKYLVQDPVSAIFHLIDQASTNLAWEHHFGGDKWANLEKKMVEQGANGDFLSQIRADVAAVTGMTGQIVPRAYKDLSSLGRLLMTVGTLPKALFVHTGMPLLTGIQSGNPLNALKILGNMLHTGVLSRNGDHARAVRDIAEMLGMESADAERAQMQHRLPSNTRTGHLISWLTQRFFKGNGISSFMRNFTANQYAMSGFKVQKLAEDIAKHNDSGWGGTYKSSNYLMQELGVPKDEVEQFSKWVNDSIASGGMSTQTLSNRNDPMAQMFSRAVIQDVKRTALSHDSAVMPRYANAAAHPFLSMMYAVSHYKKSFEKNVLMRVASLADEGGFGLGQAGGQALRAAGNTAKLDFGAARQNISNAQNAISENISKGYTAADRARLLMPAMQLPLLWLFGMGYKSAYNAVLDKKDKTPLPIQGMQRVEIGGDLQPLMNLLVGDKFANKTDIAGPYASRAEDYYNMLSNAPKLATSGKAKSAELKRIYNLVLAPAATAATTTLSIFPVPVTVGALGYINSPQARDKFVKTFR